MRTLASTFEAREEAEAASRRLETLGIPRDRIVTKYIAPGGGESGFFVSAKVSPDQIEAATEILKRPAPAAAEPGLEEASVPASAAEPPVRAPLLEPEPPPRPLPRHSAEALPVTPAPRAPAPRAPAPDVAPAADFAPAARRREDTRTVLGRYLVYYGLALVAAFMIGAWLGLLS